MVIKSAVNERFSRDTKEHFLSRGLLLELAANPDYEKNGYKKVKLMTNYHFFKEINFETQPKKDK